MSKITVNGKVINNFPTKKYDVIYADPPWQYKDKAKSGNRGVDNHYQTLSLADLCLLPVAEITNEQAVLFMWVTPPTLLDALKLAESWGFKYKTKGFCWHKLNKDGSFFRGMGHYTRANTEDVLIFTKGKCLERTNKSICQVIAAPRREHSRKPDEVRDRIIDLYSNATRLELFARSRADNWDCWGDQTTKF